MIGSIPSYIINPGGTESSITIRACQLACSIKSDFQSLEVDVVISGHPAERGTFELFVAAMAAPHLATDPRFADVASRLVNIDALLQTLRDWAATVPTAEELERRAAEAGLAMGVLRTMDEIVTTKWGADRRVVVVADDRSGGGFRVPNSPWVFSGSDTATRGVPKFRGEDNAAVLGTFLGIDSETVGRLTADGVLSERLPAD